VAVAFPAFYKIRMARLAGTVQRGHTIIILGVNVHISDEQLCYKLQRPRDLHSSESYEAAQLMAMPSIFDVRCSTLDDSLLMLLSLSLIRGIWHLAPLLLLFVVLSRLMTLVAIVRVSQNKRTCLPLD
jgi:hypothetical protein